LGRLPSGRWKTAITGRTRPEAPLDSNTFLIWKGGTVGDFTLRLKFRFKALPGADAGKANSGVQYRSQVIDPAKRIVGGYQADMDGAGRYIGMLYEERGRGILALPTQKVRLTPEAGTSAEPQAKIEVQGATASGGRPRHDHGGRGSGDWMDLMLVIEGPPAPALRERRQTAEIQDDDDAHRASSGVLALQVQRASPCASSSRTFV
jgi:hypothetical protein